MSCDAVKGKGYESMMEAKFLEVKLFVLGKGVCDGVEIIIEDVVERNRVVDLESGCCIFGTV